MICLVVKKNRFRAILAATGATAKTDKSYVGVN
jgi:hypothetical protein